MKDIFVAVISHARASRVEPMEKLGAELNWFVGRGEKTTYESAGAKNVVESGRLCESRNIALRTAWNFGLPCLQLSDDLGKIEIYSYTQSQFVQATLPEAIALFVERNKQYGDKVHLFGTAPTANDFYFDPKKQFSLRSFVVGDFILVNPCGLFFDENLSLKEDYDYTLQHICKFGGVFRSNDVLTAFGHRTNKGGAVEYRTDELEQQSIIYLRSKWKGLILDNPRRSREILLNHRLLKMEE